MFTCGALKDNAKRAKILLTITEPCLNPEFPQEQQKILPSSETPKISTWSYDMEGHAKKCVERYCGELKSVGDLSDVCPQIVLTCLYLARTSGPDILWSVNKLARAITKWTRACDKRLARSISYIHFTSEYKQYCHVGNTAQPCRLGLFQDSDFAGDLEDSMSTSGGTLCIFGSYTFVPISRMCKKQTCVTHSSTESEIISLDAGLRMGEIPALDLWDLVIQVLLPNSNKKQNSSKAQGNL